MKKAKKYYGSDVVSLLEKLYFNNLPHFGKGELR